MEFLVLINSVINFINSFSHWLISISLWYNKINMEEFSRLTSLKKTKDFVCRLWKGQDF